MGCSHNCSSCKENCGSKEKKSLRVKPNPNASVRQVIAIMSGKGGGGKSMVTGLLAS